MTRTQALATLADAIEHLECNCGNECSGTCTRALAIAAWLCLSEALDPDFAEVSK